MDTTIDRAPRWTSAAGSRALAPRLAALLYSALVYAFFLGTFLYAMGFVNGVLVPKGIDDGATRPLAETLAVDLGLLGLFAVQHSIMARRWFKRRWTRIVPAHAERSTFVLLTCIILCTMYAQWRPLPGAVWNVEQPVVAAALSALAWVGWGLVLLATFLIDHFDLFGLKQGWRRFRGIAHADPAFQVKGIYRRTRHPLYLGFIVAFWATPRMTQGHLLFAMMTTAFMLVAVRLEEKDLVDAHGEDYVEYRRQVPMLVPSLTRTYGAKSA
ncbi:MAG TPA: isoprenylcysteine carboxylmethyltransferase family protein [Planctomycetota bacterium]|nr:isoprenylcysteine carboxylmethyltransferase family protein [Planctomycetota bacterium]